MPDYKLYLSPVFIETEADMIQIADVSTFDNFIIPVPQSIDPGMYNTVSVWRESFSEFIAAANYKLSYSS